MAGLDGIKCKIGLHRWGQWEHVTAEEESAESCRTQRTCACCNTTEVREAAEHRWSEWSYASEEPCCHKQLCKECKATLRKEVHDWSEWEYLTRDDCCRRRLCRKCGAEEEGPEAHDWSDWEYVSPGSCDQRRYCKHCQATESRGDAHSWGEWGMIKDSSEEEHFCSRCHAREHTEAVNVKFKKCRCSGVCDVCNCDLGPGEGYVVPVSVFYGSEKYREYLESGPMSFAINMAGGIDNFLMDVQCLDETTHCAVCKRCIKMFQ